MRRRPFLLHLAALLPALPACKPAAMDSPTPLGKGVLFLTAWGGRAYERQQRLILDRLAATRPDLPLAVEDAQGMPEAQVEQLRKAIEARVAAVFLAPVAATPGLKAEVARAVQAGIFVYGLGEAAAPLPCTTVIATDERELGRVAGGIVLRALEAKSRAEGLATPAGRVVEIRGDDSSPACTARHEGFLEALKTAPGVLLVHDAPGGWTLEGGRDRARDAVRLQKTFDVLYAHDDAMALGAARALGELREGVLVLGTGGARGPEGGLTLVSQEEIDATVVQPPLVDFAWALLARQRAEPGFSPKPAYRLAPRPAQPKDVDGLMREEGGRFPEM